MNKRSLAIIAVALLILGAGIAWIASNIERYTRHVDDGATVDVILNPWYAAQALLDQQQKESHRSFNLHPVLEKLKPYDALVLFNSSTIGNPATRQKLMDWMHGGGHLIVTAQEEWDFDSESADPFLDSFGIRFYYQEEEYDDDYEEEYPEDAAFDEMPESVNESAALESTDTESVTEQTEESEAGQSCAFIDYDDLFEVTWNQDILLIESLGGYTLDDEYDEAIRTGESWPNALLQYQVGAGKLTVLMDPTIWHNDRIGDYDHAFLLWQLVKQDDIIWFVSSNESENLLGILWRTAPYLLIGLGFTILIWGWRRWVRFGPLIPEPSNEHRQWLEHIEAATRFDWNHHQGQAMVDQLRQDIQQIMSRHHNLSYSQDQAEWLELLTQRCKLNQQQIQESMTQPSPHREHPWMELISQLQIIRNAL